MFILYLNKANKLDIISENNIIDYLYYQKGRIPNEKDIAEYLKKKKNDKITIFFKKHDAEKAIDIIKTNISKIDDKMPLYDVYSDNIYIINKENVYKRVVTQYYRFPNKSLLEELLINLLVNAIYFSPQKGKIIIEIIYNLLILILFFFLININSNIFSS